jgi:hypothetical protein
MKRKRDLGAFPVGTSPRHTLHNSLSDSIHLDPGTKHPHGRLLPCGAKPGHRSEPRHRADRG